MSIKFTIKLGATKRESPENRKERARKDSVQGKRSQVFKSGKDYKRNPKHKGKGFE
jgi:hypothetical protein